MSLVISCCMIASVWLAGFLFMLFCSSCWAELWTTHQPIRTQVTTYVPIWKRRPAANKHHSQSEHGLQRNGPIGEHRSAACPIRTQLAILYIRTNRRAPLSCLSYHNTACNIYGPIGKRRLAKRRIRANQNIACNIYGPIGKRRSAKRSIRANQKRPLS